MVVLLAQGDAKRYFRGGYRDVVSMDVLNGLTGYILTWTLFLGLVRI